MNDPRLKWMFRGHEERKAYSMGFRDACVAAGIDAGSISIANKAVFWLPWQLKNIEAGTDPNTGPYAPVSHLRP